MTIHQEVWAWYLAQYPGCTSSLTIGNKGKLYINMTFSIRYFVDKQGQIRLLNKTVEKKYFTFTKEIINGKLHCLCSYKGEKILLESSFVIFVP